MDYVICTKAGKRPFKDTKEVFYTIKREDRFKGLTVLIEDEWYWFRDKDTLEKIPVAEGEQGPKGDDGEQGIQGPKGEDGFPTEAQWNDLVSRVEDLE